MSRRRSPRVAVGTVFFLNGLVLASWVPHIPLVKAAHGLGDGALGGVLFAMAIGAVTVLPAAGWLVSRGGSRGVTLLAAATLALALPLPVLAPSAAWVAGALWLLGAANATLDVAMNAQGVAVETALGRPVLSSFHGFFSLGGLAGAARGGGRDGPRRRGARAHARGGAGEPGRPPGDSWRAPAGAPITSRRPGPSSRGLRGGSSGSAA